MPLSLLLALLTNTRIQMDFAVALPMAKQKGKVGRRGEQGQEFFCKSGDDEPMEAKGTSTQHHTVL
jgi:hypothetical protein